MQETVGTLNLKIARLQHQLQLVQQQQVLSRPYPRHQAALQFAQVQLQDQLWQLIQFREELNKNEYLPHRIFNGEKNGSEPLYTTH